MGEIGRNLAELKESDKAYILSQFIGESASFLRVIGRVDRLSQVGTPLLVRGESGTGKELYARALHYLGPRKDKPFIPINCGAIPDNLFENELFGHERGAYTDARSNQAGLIEQAHGGTLFLDEVDSLSHHAQVKLLRFIEDGVYKPLGSSHTQLADVRIICAANANLLSDVHRGRFREDLYYRIAILDVELPPLRKRDGDVEILAVHFLTHFSRLYGTDHLVFADGVRATLRSYHWPGNIRELKNVIERAVILAAGEVIQAEDLRLGVQEPLNEHGGLAYREARRQAIEHFEKEYIRELLDRNDGDIVKVCQVSRISRKTILRLLKRRGFDTGTNPIPAGQNLSRQNQ